MNLIRLAPTILSFSTVAAVLGGCDASSPGTVPIGVSQSEATALHLSLVAKKFGKPVMIITDFHSYIWWLDNKGAVTSYATDCASPLGAVVDHKGRLVVACTNGAAVNIYNKGNTTGPADVVLSDSDAYGGRQPSGTFEDKQGNVFATNYAKGSAPGDIVWWKTTNQSTGATPSGSYVDPNMFVASADVDSRGNVYASGTQEKLSHPPEVDTIANILSDKPSATNDNVGLSSVGSIYTMGNGQISLVGQCASCSYEEIYMYKALPGSPLKTLKPKENAEGTCFLGSGGYDRADKSVLFGVLCGASGVGGGELGRVASDRWKFVLNIDFLEPLGAAFLNSDK